MRTETITIYSFEELSEEAQQKAIENWRAQGFEYTGGDEYRDSLNKFCDLIGVRVKDYYICLWGNSYINIDIPDYFEEIENTELTGLRLRTWIINNWLPLFRKGKYYSTQGDYINGRYNYKFRHSNIQFEYNSLTGFCADYSLLNPILDFVEKPDSQDIEDIINDSIESFRIDWEQDIEYQNSDEAIKESILINEHEFYSDGSMI
ncbi:MAG: hypothetical protein PVI43_00500 [Candidatus Bathyarchaeota archaeon]|jgi:hypothetical protein